MGDINNLLNRGYSNDVTETMAKYNSEIISMFAQTTFHTETVEKLFSAMNTEKLIDSDDLLNIMDWSQYPTYNEEYIDDFLSSLRKKEVHHSIAAQAFVISGRDRSPSYFDVLHLVSTGAYHTTQYGLLTLDHDVARESLELGYNLRQYVPAAKSCRELNNIGQLEQAIAEGNVILWCSSGMNPYPRLPVMIGNLSHDQLGYWDDFKKSYKDRYDKPRDGEQFKEKYYQYAYGKMLYQKVNNELRAFISDMMKKPVSDVITAAQEIAVKRDIDRSVYYYSEELNVEQSQALLNCDNALNEIYEEWTVQDDIHNIISIAAQAADNCAVWEGYNRTGNESRK